MKYCLITFRTVTPAQRGESILRRAEIGCSLQRTPRSMEEQGCGYSLRLRGTDAERARQLLREAGVGFQKTYLMGDDGRMEPV